MFLGINIFWALLRAHVNLRLTAWAKMSLTPAQNKFMPTNMNSIVLLQFLQQEPEEFALLLLCSHNP